MRGRGGGGAHRGGGRRGGGHHSRGPSLPSSLLSEISALPADRASGLAGSRKQARKQLRADKGAARAAHHESRSSGAAGAAPPPSRGYDSGGAPLPEPSRKRARDAGPPPEARKRPLVRIQADAVGGDEDDKYEDEDSDELSDIEDDTLGSTSGDGSSGAPVRALPASVAAALADYGRDAAQEEDDAVIARLERKLGLKKSGAGADAKNVRRLNREFAAEGLGDDFGTYLSALDNLVAGGAEGSSASAGDSAADEGVGDGDDDDEVDEDDDDEDNDDDDDEEADGDESEEKDGEVRAGDGEDGEGEEEAELVPVAPSPLPAPPARRKPLAPDGTLASTAAAAAGSSSEATVPSPRLERRRLQRALERLAQAHARLRTLASLQAQLQRACARGRLRLARLCAQAAVAAPPTNPAPRAQRQAQQLRLHLAQLRAARLQVSAEREALRRHSAAVARRAGLLPFVVSKEGGGDESGDRAQGEEGGTSEGEAGTEVEDEDEEHEDDGDGDDDEDDDSDEDSDGLPATDEYMVDGARGGEGDADADADSDGSNEDEDDDSDDDGGTGLSPLERARRLAAHRGAVLRFTRQTGGLVVPPGLLQPRFRTEASARPEDTRPRRAPPSTRRISWDAATRDNAKPLGRTAAGAGRLLPRSARQRQGGGGGDGGDSDEDEDGDDDDGDDDDGEDDDDDDDDGGDGEDNEDDEEGDGEGEEEGNEEDEAADDAAAEVAAPRVTPAPYVPPHLRAKAAAAAAEPAPAPAPAALALPAPSPSAPSPASPASASAHASYALALASRRAAFSRGEPELGATEAGRALARRVQGLLNRLAESNLEPLAAEAAALFRAHATADVNAALMRAVLGACEQPAAVLRPMVMGFAALLAALHVTVGPAVGACAVERAVLRFAEAAALPLDPNPSPAALREAEAQADVAAAAAAAAASALSSPVSAGLGAGAGPGAGPTPPALLPAKTAHNVLLLLAYLCVFQTAAPLLIAHVLRLLAARFAERDAELLLLLLTHVGFQMRADDPAALRDALQAVLRKVRAAGAGAGTGAGAGSGLGAGAEAEDKASANADADADAGGVDAGAAPPAAGEASTRLRMLSGMILDLKNNRRRGEVEQLLARGLQLRKWLARLAARTAGVEGVDRYVRAGWPDFMRVPEAGRWWLVGASWAGRQAAGASSLAAVPSASASAASAKGLGKRAAAAAAVAAAAAAATAAIPGSGGADSAGVFGALLGDEASGSSGGGAPPPLPASAAAAAAAAAAGAASAGDAQLLLLAQRMRMNTDARRRAFVAVMGADDADAAVERLLRLGLRGPAERDIVRVLVDCCAQEATFNLFYGVVAAHLCALHPRFRFTLQLTLWDCFRAFDDGALWTARRLYNLARLLAFLLQRGCQALAVLRPLEMGGGEADGAAACLFGRALLCALLVHAAGPAQVERVFARVGGKGADRLATRDALQLFLRQHIAPKALVATARAAGVELDRAEAAARLRAARLALDAVEAQAEDVDELLGPERR